MFLLFCTFKQKILSLSLSGHRSESIIPLFTLQLGDPDLVHRR